jgi:hypothetical protein
MAVTSVRFNSKEEKVLKYLKKYYNCDASALVKKSLWELYEEIKDKEVIEKYEKREGAKKIKYYKIDDIQGISKS